MLKSSNTKLFIWKYSIDKVLSLKIIRIIIISLLPSEHSRPVA